MKKITLLGILLLCIGVMNAQQSEKVESFNREASLQNRNTSFTETASRYVGQRSTPSVLYDNGPIETSPGASTLQNSSLGMNFLGFGHQQAASNSIADDFMLTSDFSLNEITFYAYQTGSTTTSTITGVTLQIWDGVPGAAGSNVVWGDTSTNILSSTTWSGVYRDSETSVGDTNRPIMEVTVSTLGFIGTANTTYWLDWNVDGTLGSGPWAPPVTIIGQSTTGNGLQSLDGRTTWSSAEDSGTLTQQGFPFQLTGILFTQCATDNPQPIDDFTPVTSVVTLTQPGVIGAMTNQNTFEEALVQLQHDRAGDLVMTLTSPAGTVLELSSNNGGADGLDTQAGLFFIDGQPNITTWTGAPVDAAGYEAEGGSLMATFAGEPVAGDWTLTIEDGGLGDEGDLFGFCLTITNNGVVGTPPTISCPADIVVNSDEDGAGDCEAMVVFADAAAIDAEDGPIATTQTAGPASGDAFPVGDTDVTFEATDSDGNTVSCTFTVTVIDNEDPVAVCQDITVTLDEFGMASITEADIDGGSTDNCPAFTLSASQLTFGCSDVGDVVVILTITDASGNTDTCDATVTVVDDIAPVIVCEGEAGSATYSGGAGEVINNTLPPAVSTINVADDVTLDDVNVAINISHTWVSDLTIELESPAGTVVTLYSQANNITCSDNDIDATWDDDATVLADDSCNGSSPAISGLVLPTTALSAFNGESSLGDWTLTVTDGVGGDNGTLDGWDLILSSPDLALPALDVVLDVDGLATVNAADLLVSADDACGVNVSVGGGGAPVSLTTTFASDNSFNGNWFDVVAINDLTVNSFDINLATGTTDDIEVYFKTGTSIGFETDASAWTLLDTATGITSNGTDVATPLNLNLGQVVLAGETVAFYVTTVNGGTMNYFGTGAGPIPAGDVFVSDANMEILGGSGGEYPFGPGVFTTRVFSGSVVYSEGTLSSSTIDFTCAEVGLNDVEVTVTDPSGNESTCIAQVNVIDDIAPVLVCQDIDLEIGPDGTATLDPMDLIDMTNSIEACGYDIVTADITDFDCSNVGTPVLVTLFASDPSGNIASCSAMVTATDTTGPTITCPDDVNVDPEPNGVYTLEDFTAAAVAVDNCTDPVTIITQSPAAGTALGVGTYTITISAEDDLGNIGTCDFTLVVDPIQGVNDTAFDAAISMYPNPADNVVTIANRSNIALENAAIYDINGKLVSTIDLAGMQSERTIDVAALASGVYVVQITGENAVTTKRLIKK